MAYGNWGAFVYRNGERMTAWEDQTPFREREYESGYHQAFGISNLTQALAAPDAIPETAKLDRAKELGPHHAVLGDGDVRLCGYKSSPCLYLRGETVSLEPFIVSTYDSWTDSEGVKHDDADEWKGELEGVKFRAVFDTGSLNMIDLELTEVDGTVWTARCGYCYGAGHDD